MDDASKARVRQVLPKDLIIDLEDRCRAEAQKAFEVVRDGTGLNQKRARELEGQARFRMMEQGFEEVCKLHGGRLLDGGIIPSTELRVFQPYMRFEAEGTGVIVGLAAMPEPRTVPHKNKSRVAGASINYTLAPHLDLDDSGPKIGDIFVLLLFSRDHEKGGQIAELAVGIVNSSYENFLFYEPFDTFLSAHVDVPGSISTTEPPAATPPTVKLKPHVTPFVPPEAPAEDDKKTGSE